MQRWLFLSKEPRARIEKFSYELTDAFGKTPWEFTKFVQEQVARQPTSKGYFLEDCFRQKGKIEDVKLVIGQENFGKPSIRFAFKHEDIWADFILEHSAERYAKTGELFTRNFNYLLETYPHQHEVK